MVRSNSNPWRKKLVTTFQKKPRNSEVSMDEAKPQNNTSRTALLAIKIEADSGAKDQESVSITGLTRQNFRLFISQLIFEIPQYPSNQILTKF